MQTNTEHEEDDPDLGKLIGETGISNKARRKGTNQDASEQIARDWRDLPTMSECAHPKSHDQASNDHGNEKGVMVHLISQHHCRAWQFILQSPQGRKPVYSV